MLYNHRLDDLITKVDILVILVYSFRTSANIFCENYISI